MGQWELLREYYSGEIDCLPDDETLNWFKEQRLLPFLVGTISSSQMEFKQMRMIRSIKAHKEIVQLNLICSCLKEHAIIYMLVKGYAVATTYPQTYMRSMGDYDIVVERSSLTGAIEALSTIGYLPNGKSNNKDITLEKEGELKIELHHALFVKSRISQKDDILGDLWNSKETMFLESYSIVVPSPEWHLRYLILHSLHHFKGSGVGVRFLLDLVYFSKFHGLSLFSDYEYFEKMGYGMYYRCLMSSIVHGLGVSGNEPEWVLDKSDPVLTEFMAFMEQDGLFNDASEQSKTTSLYVNVVNPYRTRNKMKTAISFLCPSQDDLSNNYEYAKNNRWLLPVAWLHRMCRYFFRRDLNMREKAFMFTKDDGALERRTYLMKALGFYEN